ncbi:hypothetical protein N8612_02475 [Verrucomicrobia bacterium]|nr:hypothetical protein [Verrucomicrobiota bacterium]
MTPIHHGVLIFEATGIFLSYIPVRYGVFIYESTRCDANSTYFSILTIPFSLFSSPYRL